MQATIKIGAKGNCPTALNFLFRASGPPFLLNARPCAFTCLGLRCLDPNRPQKSFNSP